MDVGANGFGAAVEPLLRDGVDGRTIAVGIDGERYKARGKRRCPM